jgi:hypothetical protein
VGELSRRCFYMERILKCRCPELSLDTECLQQAYEAISQCEVDLDDLNSLELEEEDDLVSLDEEVCTIDPVEENITRSVVL